MMDECEQAPVRLSSKTLLDKMREAGEADAWLQAQPPLYTKDREISSATTAELYTDKDRQVSTSASELYTDNNRQISAATTDSCTSSNMQVSCPSSETASQSRLRVVVKMLELGRSLQLIKTLPDLAPTGHAGGVAVLKKHSIDCSCFVRLHSVIGLGKIANRDDKAAVFALAARCDDPSWLVRRAAVTALGNTAGLETASFAQRVVGGLLKDPSPEVRAAAEEAMEALLGSRYSSKDSSSSGKQSRRSSKQSRKSCKASQPEVLEEKAPDASPLCSAAEAPDDSQPSAGPRASLVKSSGTARPEPPSAEEALAVAGGAILAISLALVAERLLARK